MKAALTALVLSLLAASCAQKEPSPESSPLPPEKRLSATVEAAHTFETHNLLNAGFGAAVVSRTAELTLENSAARAIDGDAESMWASPPNDVRQTLVFSLPATARVEKVGARTLAAPPAATKALAIELSLDGVTYRPAASPRLRQTGDVQLFDIAPADARYVRVTTSEGGGRLASLQSVHLRGRWLGPRSVAPLAGCWTVNGASAAFAESGGRVTGFVGDANGVGDDAPVHVDGGAEQASYRFAWSRGAQWGYAFVTLTPDGSRLTGMTWHEEAAAHSYGTTWFGERGPCTTATAAGDGVVAGFLRRAGWYPLFSLRFSNDDVLDVVQSAGGLQIIDDVVRKVRSERVRVLAREYHEATAEANRRRAAKRIESLRTALAARGVDVSHIDFVALGSDSPRRPTATEPMRLLYGVVEIELSPKARSAF